MDNMSKIIRDRVFDQLTLFASELKYDALIPINIRKEIPSDGYSIKEMPMIAIDLPQMDGYEMFDYSSTRSTWTIPVGIFDRTETTFEKKQADEERLMNIFSRMVRVINTKGVNMRDYLVYPHFVSFSLQNIEQIGGGVSSLYCEIQLPVISYI